MRRIAWSALFGLSLLGRPALAAEPAPLSLPPTNQNQVMAEAIASHLSQSAVLHHYTVDVRVQGGDVELSGTVADQTQREEVHRLVQGQPGVVRVVDRLKLADGGTPLVRTAVGDMPPKLPDPSANNKAGAPNAPALPAMPPRAGGPIPEPAPIHTSPPGAYSEFNPPKMPPYAWPTYAPYNNYSRVAYPNAHPWQSWPFIGPVYPFPKVPLGWRSVKLEFDDGYWWFGQVGNKWNWWKIRYW